MKVKIKSMVYFSTLLLFAQGCEEKSTTEKSTTEKSTTEKSTTENSTTEKNHTEVKEEIKIKDEKLSDELKKQVVDAIYIVNNKQYSVKNLPKEYTEVSGKKRSLFLEKYINYTLSLAKLKKEQEEYKNQIEKEIKKEFQRRNHLGIEIEGLDKKLLTLDLTLKTIAKEELAKEKKDLDKEIKEFYKEHKKEYTYDDNIELSYIYFKDENRSKEVFQKIKEKEVDIKRFAMFAKEYGANKKLKFSGGYFGFLSKSEKQINFFNQLWNSKKEGFIDEIIERDGYFFLVYVHQKREAFTAKFEDVKDEIRDSIIGKPAKVNKWINVRYRELMKKTKVKVLDSFEDNKSF